MSLDRTQPYLVHLDGVHVHYGSAPALESASLALRPGGSIALIGPNGAGKSTLLKAVLGLVPIRSGTLSVLGGSPAEHRGRMAYVPQADTLDAEFPVTVLDVVLMGRYRRIGWGRRPKPADRQVARNALQDVELLDRAGDRFGALSGGQRQRVLLARAVAQEAEVLLLDEPFNGLDATTTEILLQVIDRLRAQGTGLLMSTHDLTVARLACGDACLLNREQVAFGPLDEILTSELLTETYGRSALLLEGGTVVAHH